jgi:hypothetical protein
MSKTNFAMYFLDYFYHTMLAKRLLNFIEPNINPLFLFKILGLRKKYSSIFTEMYTVDFYYFMSSKWCLLLFRVIEFSKLHPSVFRLKPLKPRGYVPQKLTVNLYNRHMV